MTWSATPFSARLPHQSWTNAGLAAILLLALLGVAYLAFGPLRPDPERPRFLPAAVGPSPTPSFADQTPTPAQAMPTTVPPTATPLLGSAIGQTIAGTWQWTRQGVDITVVFNADGSYLEYTLEDGVGLGGWRQTGERTFELVVVYQTPTAPLAREEIFAPDYVPTGLTFQPGVAIMRLGIELDPSGQTMIAAGSVEQRDAAGTVTNVFDVGSQFLTRVSGAVPPGAIGVAGVLSVQVVAEDGMTRIGGSCLGLIGASTVSVCDDGPGDVDPNPGVIELEGLPDGEYTVAVLPPEGFQYAGGEQTLVVLLGQASSLYITLLRIGSAIVEPTVVTPPTPPSELGNVSIQVIAEDGTPIGGVCLDLTGPVATYSVCDDGALDVDPTPGIIELIGLSGGEYNVTLFPTTGYEPANGWATLRVQPGEIATLTITLRPAGSVVVPTATVPPLPIPTATPVT